MTLRSKYLAVFGLKEDASEQDIRKAYRKLAKIYHPDKNADPKAHQLFLDLNEAYEKLINNDFTLSKKEKSHEDRVKDAKIRFEEQQKRKQAQEHRYFQRLTEGWRWKVYKTFAISSVVCAIFIFIDYFLPFHQEKHIVSAYSPKYNGLVKGNVRCLKTDKNLTLFVNTPYPVMYSTRPEIEVLRTWVFHHPVKVTHQTSFYKKEFDVDFSVLSLFPVICVLFLFPLIPLLYKQKTVLFSIIYLLNFNLVSIAFLYFLFTESRLIHLLSLGFV